MMTPDKLVPAFPFIAPPESGSRVYPGMSYHDWIVGMALSGLLAKPRRHAPVDAVRMAHEIADNAVAQRESNRLAAIQSANARRNGEERI